MRVACRLLLLVSVADAALTNLGHLYRSTATATASHYSPPASASGKW